jgi:hypothetical protein
MHYSLMGKNLNRILIETRGGNSHVDVIYIL